MATDEDSASAPEQVTIYDIAREVGMSPSTVSRALSKPGRVSFATAERIRQVADDLGYHSEAIRRTLAPARTRMLAMVVPDITNPVFFGMIRGAERAAGEAGYTLLLVESQESVTAERDILDRLLPAVDGVVLSGSRLADGEIRKAAKQRPAVLLNRRVSRVASVLSDNLRAVKRAAEHLGELGHSTITYLAGPETSYADALRWRGLREAGIELGLRVRRLGPTQPTLAGGAALVPDWLEYRSSAVVACNDMVAIGFIRAALEAGVRVPAEVSVIGFDNILEASLMTPRLTTLATPLVTLGVTAINHLLSTVGVSDDAPPVLLPVRLVVRDSTAPAD
ncbi:MAG: LacI family DNA-binding transcriptional regulator [Propionibacteriaceae bacterium]